MGHRHLHALLYDDKSKSDFVNQNLPIVQRITNTLVHEYIRNCTGTISIESIFTLDRNIYSPITAINVTKRQLSDLS